MVDPRGFLTTDRQSVPARPVGERVRDWHEVYPGDVGRALLPIIGAQAGRCMDCGVPFCHDGCPLGNLIPEWNDLVWQQDWVAAGERLHATNNFPEFTGRLCPAPCESSCVLGINAEPVTIKNVEVAIADRAVADGLVRPMPPDRLTGRSVAVVGSGPAGLAAAQQLTRVGHTAVVYERDDRPGGLLRYGIPEFKMEKRHLDHRLAQMTGEGTVFRTGVEVGRDVTGQGLRDRHDAVILAVGALQPRDLPLPGRELAGVHLAMDYLTPANRATLGAGLNRQLTVVDHQPTAAGRRVVIIGGGDTGADCLGTAVRQGAAGITQLQHHPRPPDVRSSADPWPTYPTIFRTSPAYEEAGERVFAVRTEEFVGDAGRVRAVRVVGVRRRGDRFVPLAGTERELPADLVLIATGFRGPQPSPVYEQLGAAVDDRGLLRRDAAYRSTAPAVFVAGDAGRGQSLIVWAIAEGRACAAAVDRWLTGSTTLPAPIPATARPLAATAGAAPVEAGA